jgi:hypothetical protein
MQDDILAPFALNRKVKQNYPTTDKDLERHPMAVS